MQNPQSILITGGSSGIGEGLALSYAQPGITITITGRDAERVKAVETALKEKGADAEGVVIDVTDEQGMKNLITRIDKKKPLDLVIANAGIGVKDRSVPIHQVATQTFAVNVGGVFNTVHPALECMLSRHKGQIAIISSVAGFVGMPFFGAYSASKNAVRAYGEALRGQYERKGIEINVVCPGFVASRMTENNDFSMPFFMKTEKAVEIITKKLAKNKGRIVFPWQMHVFVRMAQILPSALVHLMLRAKPKKE